MIVRPHPTFLEKTFAINGSIIVAIGPLILVAAVLGFVAAHFVQEDEQFSFSPFTALGVAISLFLGFRNNASYDRWWEGRKQWGKQVIVTRNLARAAITFIPPSDCTNKSSDAYIIANLGVAHSHALRAQLRKSWYVGFKRSKTPTSATTSFALSYPEEAFTESEKFIPIEHHQSISSSANRADAILRLANSYVAKCLHDPNCQLDTIGAKTIHESIDGLSWVQGSCERLASALVPFPYSLLVHRSVLFYVILLPFAMASNSLGYLTILFNSIIAYTFFGLDETARLMEQPFGDEPLCLSMNAICRTIEISVREATLLVPPKPLEPDAKHCLM